MFTPYHPKVLSVLTGTTWTMVSLVAIRLQHQGATGICVL